MSAGLNILAILGVCVCCTGCFDYEFLGVLAMPLCDHVHIDD